MFGPLFSKELIETSRRRRYYFLRCVFAVLLFITLAILVSSLSDRTLLTRNYVARANLRWGQSERSILTTQDYARIGSQIFDIWSLATLWGVAILAPAMVCGLIAGEKDGRTFETLLTTCLTDREILLGKIASRFFILAITLFASVPIVALATLYGGFDIRRIGYAGMIHAANLVFTCVLGVYYSTVTRKPYVALIRCYFALFVLWIIVPSFGPRFFDSMGNLGLRRLLPYFSPWSAIGQEFFEDQAQGRFFPRGNPLNNMPSVGVASNPLWLAGINPAPVFCAIYILLSALILIRCRKLLRVERLWADEPRLYRWFRLAYSGLVRGATTSVEARSEKAGWKFLWRLELASRRWFRLSNYLGEPSNPITLRDSTARVYDPEKYVSSLQILFCVGMFCWFVFSIYFTNRYSFEIVNVRWLLHMMFLALLLLAAILSSAAYARERQYSSWEMLLLTDITAKEYIRGAILGVTRCLLPMILLMTICALLLGYMGDKIADLIEWAFGAMSWLFFVIVIGLSQSISCDRIFAAFVRVFLLFAITICFLVALNPRIDSFLAMAFGAALLILVTTGPIKPELKTFFCGTLIALMSVLVHNEVNPTQFSRFPQYGGPIQSPSVGGYLLVGILTPLILYWLPNRHSQNAKRNWRFLLVACLAAFVYVQFYSEGGRTAVSPRYQADYGSAGLLDGTLLRVQHLLGVDFSQARGWNSYQRIPTRGAPQIFWVFACSFAMLSILRLYFDSFVGRFVLKAPDEVD